MDLITLGLEFKSQEEKSTLLKLLNRKILSQLSLKNQLFESNILEFQVNGLLVFLHFNQNSEWTEEKVLELINSGMKSEGVEYQAQNLIDQQPMTLV